MNIESLTLKNKCKTNKISVLSKISNGEKCFIKLSLIIRYKNRFAFFLTELISLIFIIFFFRFERSSHNIMGSLEKKKAKCVLRIRAFIKFYIFISAFFKVSVDSIAFVHDCKL